MLQKNWEKLGLLINLNIIDTNKQNLQKKIEALNKKIPDTHRS